MRKLFNIGVEGNMWTLKSAWSNRILYAYLNTIRIHFLSNREVFCIRGFFGIKVFVFVFEYIAKVMYS